MDKDTRRVVLYVIGIFVVITIIFLAIVQFSQTGIGILGNDSTQKTYTKAETVIDKAKDYTAVIKTSKGNVTVDLLEKNAPNTVNSFVFLAKDGFFNGTEFHRVIKDFVIQGGSRLTLDSNPLNDGLGGPGYRFENEINWDSLKLTSEVRKSLEAEGFKSDTAVTSVPMEKYTLAMAHAGPGTNGSQFFIVTGAADSPSIKALNGKHTVFGTITGGKDIVDLINNVELKNANTDSPRPVAAITIQSIEITEK